MIILHVKAAVRWPSSTPSPQLEWFTHWRRPAAKGSWIPAPVIPPRRAHRRTPRAPSTGGAAATTWSTPCASARPLWMLRRGKRGTPVHS